MGDLGGVDACVELCVFVCVHVILWVCVHVFVLALYVWVFGVCAHAYMCVCCMCACVFCCFLCKKKGVVLLLSEWLKVGEAFVHSVDNI